MSNKVLFLGGPANGKHFNLPDELPLCWNVETIHNGEIKQYVYTRKTYRLTGGAEHYFYSHGTIDEGNLVSSLKNI